MIGFEKWGTQIWMQEMIFEPPCFCEHRASRIRVKGCLIRLALEVACVGDLPTNSICHDRKKGSAPRRGILCRAVLGALFAPVAFP